MKKFFTLLILGLFLFQNIALAEEITEIRLDEIVYSRYFPMTLEFPKVVHIKYETQPLASKLKRKYIAEKYTVTNLTTNPIKIVTNKKEKFIDVNSAVSRIKWNRKRNLKANYKNSLDGLGNLIGVTLLIPLFILYPPSLLMLVMLDDDGCGTHMSLNDIVILPVTSTIMAPYNHFKDKHDDEIFAKDIESYTNHEPFGIIEPEGQFEFVLLRLKKYKDDPAGLTY